MRCRKLQLVQGVGRISLLWQEYLASLLTQNGIAAFKCNGGVGGMRLSVLEVVD